MLCNIHFQKYDRYKILTTIIYCYEKGLEPRLRQLIYSSNLIFPGGGGGTLPINGLMGMCRWMGSHFHDRTDYNWPCSKLAGDWVRTYFFLVRTFNIDLIKNGARHLKEHPKISKFTKFDGYWFKRKGMVRF